MIRFATVGTSWITDEFISTLKTFPEARLYAVYSRSEEKAKAFSEKHGAERVFTDLKAMSECPDIDAVYIASPNSCHYEQSLLFINAKKNVICEKPAASNLSELKKVTDAARKIGVTYMEAYKSAFMPGMMTIKDNLHKLGVIRSVYFTFSKYSTRYDAHKAGGDVNTFKAEFSNGSLMDLGIYCLSPMIHLFGAPTEIKSFSAKVPGGVDGMGAILMQYPTFVATLNYSKVSDTFLPAEISGELATMRIDKINIPEKIEIVYRDRSIPSEVYIPDQRQDGMCYEIADFMESVSLGRVESPIHTHEITEKVMEIMDEARKQGNVLYPSDK